MGVEHEQVIPNAGLPFKIFQFEGKNGNYMRDRHWHRPIEIFAVYAGRVRFQVGETDATLTPGEFIVVNSNEIHSIQAMNPNDTVVLQIPPYLFDTYTSRGEFVFFSHQPREEDQEVLSLLSSIHRSCRNKELGYEFSAQSDFYRLLYLLVTRYQTAEISQEVRKNYRKLNRLTVITDYIREHYQEEVTLEVLSEKFGYAPAYISRMFKKYGQVNFKTYLMNLRLEMAYQELMRTDRSIVDIALSNGFPNSKSFSNCFLEKYGVLPSVYRKSKQ